jgi:pilus assembly protein Flp/PilA
MINFVRNFARNDNGASAAEYALILAIVGTGIAAAAVTLGTNISGAMTTAGTCISSKGATC